MSKYKEYSLLNILLWIGWPLFITLAVVLMFFTCSSNKTDSQVEETTNVSTNIKKNDFRMISIPDSLTAPEERANYLVMNYWNHFDFSDTAFIHLPEVTEQAFVDYLDALNHTPKESIPLSIHHLLDRAKTEDTSGKMYAYFLDLFNQYTYDPNSPLLNEELYIPVTEYIIEDEVSDFATTERAKFALRMMLKNRKDTPVTDFKYITVDSKKGSLYSLKKDYTLLYIYNPDCPSCKETASYMQESVILNHLLQNGKLDILAVYPDDEINLWREHSKSLSNLWIVARDEPQLIRDKQLYNLRAIPTMYLLDKDKKVILKDTNIPRIEGYLSL